MTRLHTTSLYCAALLALLSFYGCDNGAPEKVPPESRTDTTEKSLEPAQAETKPDAGSESIAVWVNGDPLREGEVERHLRRIESIYAARQNPLDGPQKVMKRRLVTEKLIDKRLVEQWIASHEKPPVSTDVVEAALEERIAESFGDRAILERHLERRGETLAEYRRGLRERIVLEHLLKTSPDPAGESDAGSVEQKFEEVVARPPFSIRVRTASLFLPWPDDVDRDAFRDDVIKRTTAADDFVEFQKIAKELESSAQARFQADTGWTELGETATDVERTLFKTEPGHVTEAVTTPLGLQLYFVREREKTESPQLEKLRPVLEKRLKEERFLDQRRALVDRLRKDAVIRWNKKEGNQ